MSNTIPIYESKNSEKVVVFCIGVYQLLQYCSMPQARKIVKAHENGDLITTYFTPSGKVRSTRF